MNPNSYFSVLNLDKLVGDSDYSAIGCICRQDPNQQSGNVDYYPIASVNKKYLYLGLNPQNGNAEFSTVDIKNYNQTNYQEDELPVTYDINNNPIVDSKLRLYSLKNLVDF